MRRYRAALAASVRKLDAEPRNSTALRQLGNALLGLKRYEDAIAAYDRALAIVPDSAAIWWDRSQALSAIRGRPSPSISDEELARAPLDSDGWTVRAGALHRLRRFAEASSASDRALELDPENVAAARVGIQSRLVTCDWRRREADELRVETGLRRGEAIAKPLTVRLMLDSDEAHLIAARLWAGDQPATAKAPSGGTYHDKIRVAYVSAEFTAGVVGTLIVGCFEHHDRTQFETTAVSLMRGDGSETARRIRAAFDRYIDAEAMDDAAIAQMLRSLEVDIAVNLNGYPGHVRNGIFARRPAPVQVNYLAYPGTLGAQFMDYLLADRIVVPDANRIYYSEEVAYLPHSYMPNDNSRRTAARSPTRRDLGLPERGFIFACLQETQKINPVMFAAWMRLLHAVEGSVLWLRSNGPAVQSALRQEAEQRDIGPERLLFARRLPELHEYVAALGVADLLLDVHPYNGHATACDALWAGVPVLTRLGNSFQSRVGASVLHAAGLPELVTTSLAEYEALALALAHDPERLATLRERLRRNRHTAPLFDTARFTRHLESAYATMYARHKAKLPPVSFTVAD